MRKPTRSRMAGLVGIAAALSMSVAGCRSGDGTAAPTTSPATTSTAVPTTPASPTTTETTPATATPTTLPVIPSGTPTVVPSLTAGQIFTKAAANASAATSVHVVGEITNSSERVRVDMSGRIDGTNQDVSLAFDTKGTIVIRTVAGATYVKVDERAAAALGAKNAAGLSGKWIAAPAALVAPLADVNLKTLVARMGTIERFDDRVEKVQCGAIECYRLTTSGVDAGVALVAADGSFTVQRVQGSGPSRSDLAFSQWNAVPDIPAPAAGEVITLGGITNPATSPS